MQVFLSNVSHRRMAVLLTLPWKWENRSRELQHWVRTAKFMPWLMDLSLSLQAVSSSSRPVPLPSQAPAKLLSSSPTSPFTPWLCHPCQTGQESGGSLETVPAPSKLVNMQHALHSDTSGDLTELIKREGGRTRMKGAVKSIRPGCISQG